MLWSPLLSSWCILHAGMCGIGQSAGHTCGRSQQQLECHWAPVPSWLPSALQPLVPADIRARCWQATCLRPGTYANARPGLSVRLHREDTMSDPPWSMGVRPSTHCALLQECWLCSTPQSASKTLCPTTSHYNASQCMTEITGGSLCKAHHLYTCHAVRITAVHSPQAASAC